MSFFELCTADGDSGMTVFISRGAARAFELEAAIDDERPDVTLVEVTDPSDLLAPERINECAKTAGPLATGQCESLVA